MTRDDALARLRALEPELRGKGVRALFLFGSYARDDAGPESDVDLFCDVEDQAPLGFAFFAIADRLSELLGLPVDLTTRDGLHRLIRDDVAREAVRVF